MSIHTRMLALAVRRPRTIPAILGASWAFRARDWYRRLPFLPVPPASYMRWRMETAFGDADVVPSFDDLERYLLWTARMRRRIGGRTATEGPTHD